MIISMLEPISKILPTAPFTPVGVTMKPVSNQNTRLSTKLKNPLFHWSLTPIGVKGAVGRIFDISSVLTRVKYDFL